MVVVALLVVVKRSCRIETHVRHSGPKPRTQTLVARKRRGTGKTSGWLNLEAGGSGERLTYEVRDLRGAKLPLLTCQRELGVRGEAFRRSPAG